jgi:membrane-bound lytic murein transglycosylase A
MADARFSRIAVAIFALVALLSACAPVRPERLALVPLRFTHLPGWKHDRPGEAIPAFLKSCARIESLAETAPLGPDGFAGTVADWRPLCRQAAQLPVADDAAARAFFERGFRPYQLAVGRRTEGLFTGYYEAELRGTRKRGGAYTIPLYGLPDDLVAVDLGRFDPELEGRRIAGKVVKGKLEPYASRAEINAGALTGRNLEIVWVDDPVAAFLVQVQGSGRVRLAEGGTLRIGYAGFNGHPYVSIGAELIRRGEIVREAVSIPAIVQWIGAHPEEGAALLETNPAYVFFRVVEGDGPIGAAGVALTPGRSLAIDPAFLPYGAPMWIDTHNPDRYEPPLRRLLITQDTGAAIKGPIRGDVFWGFGEQAAAKAGAMRHRGEAWLLLPRSVSPPTAPEVSRGVAPLPIGG